MNEHPQWTQAAKSLLDESTQKLDAATLSRLNRARQHALGQRRQASRWIVPAGLASACMLLLAVAAWHGRTPTHPRSDAVVPVASAGDNDVANDDDDFYEDLDFYAWLDAQDQDPEG